MNLVNGRVLETADCEPILAELRARVLQTIEKGGLDAETVIGACHRLVTELDEAAYLQAMAELGVSAARGGGYIAQARELFCADALRARLRAELGENYGRASEYLPLSGRRRVREQILPLGVLLHIAAGNMDALPVFSVLEGLLTGNVNILKLPAAEGGVSIRLLSELIKIEPSLAEYIYVFDYSSRDIENLEKLISVSDAVAVWGGDEAVSALRRLVKPNTKLIEWGHKVSFAYVTPRGVTEAALSGLAEHIAETNQLLCSSCQGIFVDTDDMARVHDFCERLLPVLEARRRANGAIGIGISSQVTLEVYTAELEAVQIREKRVFRGDRCSLTATPDRALESAIGYCNAWVKPLPRAALLSALRPHKNHLQTVGLLCAQDERDALTELFFKAGAVRVSAGARMSGTHVGAARDGEYALRRYTKVVCAED
ncbi:MAG: acyl-CoA reductase [Oscillospiraceae bacterium]|nr:acyl-CoA reductase [Oscillospiraceae bacterium]